MPVNDGTQDAFKPRRLYQLIRKIFTIKKRTLQLKTLDTVLRKSIAGLGIETNLTEALKYVEETEGNLIEAKECLSQAKEENKHIFKEMSNETRKAELIAESQSAYVLDYFSGLKLLIKILLEAKTQEGFLEKIGELLEWLGFQSSSVTVYAEEEVIGRQTWKALIIKSAKCRTWDDMSADIRRRHIGLKDIFEGAGGKFFYQAIPFKGTQIILKMPFRAPSLSNKHIRVLCVDDDKEYVDSFREFLKDFRGSVSGPTARLLLDAVFDISWALHTASALAALQEQEPHIAIVKVVVKEPYSYASLSNDRGVKLISKIKELHNKVKCIAHIVCELPQPRMYYLLKELGADHVVRRMHSYQQLAQQLRVMVWEYHLESTP